MIAITPAAAYLEHMENAASLALRFAEPSDSLLLATAALAAGGGIYEHLVSAATRGISPETALAAAIASDGDGLVWRNGILAEDNGALGAAIAYSGNDFRMPAEIDAVAGSEAKADLRGLFAAMPPTDSFYLHAIWVDAMARGRGVGALLLDSVIAFGKDEGYSRTSLHVWADNHAALALYRSRGFVVLEELPVPRRPLMQHDGGKYLMATPA